MFEDETEDQEFCLVDNLALPKCDLVSNGLPANMRINEFDNIICARDEVGEPGFEPATYYSLNEGSFIMKFGEESFDAEMTKISGYTIKDGG